MQKPMISVRRRSTLAQTIRTENWLHDMAQKGFFLRQFCLEPTTGLSRASPEMFGIF